MAAELRRSSRSARNGQGEHLQMFAVGLALYVPDDTPGHEQHMPCQLLVEYI
jgi:hypothetical protein